MSGSDTRPENTNYWHQQVWQRQRRLGRSRWSVATGAGTGSHSFVATIAIILSLPPCEITWEQTQILNQCLFKCGSQYLRTSWKWCSYDPPKGQKGCQDICLSFSNLDNFSLCSHESCSQMSPHAADWQMSGAAWHNDITHLLRCCGITLPRPVTTRPGLWLVSQAQGRPLMGHFGSEFTVGCGQL